MATSPVANVTSSKTTSVPNQRYPRIPPVVLVALLLTVVPSTSILLSVSFLVSVAFQAISAINPAIDSFAEAVAPEASIVAESFILLI